MVDIAIPDLGTEPIIYDLEMNENSIVAEFKKAGINCHLKMVKEPSD